jgi:anaerobic magnesium-protoporphyrin IX monomethyl ester cyclase
MFALLAQVPCGLFQFEIGIQSCNKETLEAVKRRMDIEQALENIRRLVALDTIHIHADLILGLPFETKDSFLASFNHVFQSGPHHIQLGLLKVLPGTEMWARAEEFGLVYCAEPPYEVLATRWLSHKQLHEMYEFCECVEAFYNTRFFVSLWKYLRQSNEEPSAFFQTLLTICQEHDFFRLAHTQAFMNQILVQLAEQRQDKNLLLDLLRYDWLRCGHRFLPKELLATPQPELRDQLRQTLPQELEGFFSARSRTEFLKQSVFLELSAPAMELLGLGNAPAILAVLPEQRTGLMPFRNVAVLPG